MLKLKLQYFGHLMQRTDSLEKTLMLGKIEGGSKRKRQRMTWLDGITDSTDMVLILNPKFLLILFHFNHIFKSLHSLPCFTNATVFHSVFCFDTGLVIFALI